MSLEKKEVLPLNAGFKVMSKLAAEEGQLSPYPR